MKLVAIAAAGLSVMDPTPLSVSSYKTILDCKVLLAANVYVPVPLAAKPRFIFGSSPDACKLGAVPVSAFTIVNSFTADVVGVNISNSLLFSSNRELFW